MRRCESIWSLNSRIRQQMEPITWRRKTMHLRPNRLTRRCFSSTAASAAAAASSSTSSSPSSPSSPLPPLHVLRLDPFRIPLFAQLRIEEALLRSPTARIHNYCLLNHPPPNDKNIVLGLSNRVKDLVQIDEAEKDDVTLIRRFSGGGTVYVDQHCWMATMIINKEDVNKSGSGSSKSNDNVAHVHTPPAAAGAASSASVFSSITSAGSDSPSHSTPSVRPFLPVSPSVSAPPLSVAHPSSLPCFPRQLMEWTHDFYKPIFQPPSSSSLIQKTTTSTMNTNLTEEDVEQMEQEAAVEATMDTKPLEEEETQSATPTATSFSASSEVSLSSSSSLPSFSLTGSDYCFSSRKFGGNAQSVTRNRWLHHTSFLWSLGSLTHIEKYLTLPQKQPQYRKNRTHEEFLISLSEVWKRVKKERAEIKSSLTQQLEREQHEQHERELEELEAKRNEGSNHSLYEGRGMENAEAEDSSSSSSLIRPIDPTLPSHFLHRLSHFFTLVYPSLDSIAAIVEEYESKNKSGVKRLDYGEEREKARKEKEAAAEKQGAKP